MTAALCIFGLALINWLKGFSFGDNLPASEEIPKWQQAVNLLRSDGFSGIWFAALAFAASWPSPVSWKLSLALGIGIAAFYAYGSSLLYHKRVLFVCWNGNKNDLFRYIDNGIEKAVAGKWDKNPKVAAMRYGAFAGLAYALPLMIVCVHEIAAGRFGVINAAAPLPALLYGFVYWCMNALPNPDKYGETVGRGIYGAAIGFGLWLAVL